MITCNSNNKVNCTLHIQQIVANSSRLQQYELSIRHLLMCLQGFIPNRSFLETIQKLKIKLRKNKKKIKIDHEQQEQRMKSQRIIAGCKVATLKQETIQVQEQQRTRVKATSCTLCWSLQATTAMAKGTTTRTK